MSWVAVAIGGAAVIGAGASYMGGKKQADAAKDAANLNMEQFRLINRQQQPFIQGGYGAMGRLNTLLGLNPRPAPPSAAPMQEQLPAMGGWAGGVQRALPGLRIPGAPSPKQAQAARLNELLATRDLNVDRLRSAMAGSLRMG